MSRQHTTRAAKVVLLLLVAAVLLAPGRTPAAVQAPEPGPGVVGVWPLTPVPTVLAGFDPPGQPWDAGHRGVDLAGSVGQSVRAALAGTVRFAGGLAGRGVVVVDHGDTRSTYEPVDAAVGVGTSVTTGQVVGSLDLSGGHCLPRACLHWGLLRGETYLNPLSILGNGPVRLLPLWRAAPVSVSAGPAARAGVRVRQRRPTDAWMGAVLAVRTIIGPIMGLIIGRGLGFPA